MSANITPDANVIYRAYLEGQVLAGTTQIDLPNLQMLTAEVGGAGIGGKIDKPVTGMFAAASMTFNFRTITPEAFRLLEEGQHHLEFWSTVQVTIPGSGQFGKVQHKVIVRGEFKNLTPGKLAVAETQDRTIEMGIVYYKELYGGVEYLELDWYNLVYRVRGRDQLASTRALLGM